MEDNRQQDAHPVAQGEGVGTADEIKVLACVHCQGPVPSNAPKCYTCGAPVTGKEFPYIPMQTSSGADIPGLLKWWAILSVAVCALGGFSFGVGFWLSFSVISLVFMFRILKAYYS